MTAEIIKIGNSRGIRIPKPLLEQCGLAGTVELRVEGDQLIVSPARAPRSGWDEAFRKAESCESDELLLDGVQNEFDAEAWKW